MIVGIHEDKPRPTIITRLDSNTVEGIYGQSNPDPLGKEPHYSPSAEKHSTMGLTKETFFRRCNVVIVHSAALEKKIGSCPYDDMLLVVEPLVWEFHKERAKQRR